MLGREASSAFASPPLAGATRRLRIRWPRDPVIGALPLELAMKSTVNTAWLLLLALLGSALAAAEGGSPSACAGAEACVEEASEDDPVALLQARQPAAAAGADEVGGAANNGCRKKDEECNTEWPWQKSKCCKGCCKQGEGPGWGCC
ncbi:unnamed protein product [Polarella glacialis]|uniref:Uncharacterized protein n=2 Tax=Polarella glacialis TaxID=89957 RepID=A0A813K296_POLGL|nr:unnamed protein product [Polarella glacialis]